MSTKRILSLVLALVMVLGTFGTVFAEEPTSNPKVDWLVEQGYVLGDANGLRLEDGITRAEVSVIVAKALGLETEAAAMANIPSKFSDMKAGYAWANGFVNVLNANGYISGYPNGTFGPANEITYAEVASMLVRVMGGLTEAEAKTAVWPTTYLAKAASLGIFEGVAGVDYSAKAVRGKIFEMTYNTLDKEVGNNTVVKAIVLENNRVEKIGANEVVVEVIKVEQTSNYANASRLDKGDQKNFVIDAKLGDVENLLGQVANFTINNDGKVIKITPDTSYKVVSGPVTQMSSTKFNGYTVELGERYKGTDERIFRTYHNDTAYSYEDFIKNVKSVDYARVTVKNGKVILIDSYTFADIAPVQEVKRDGQDVYVYNDYRDARVEKFEPRALVMAFNNGKFTRIERKDIKANDVVHVYGSLNNRLIVRQDALVEGTYQKVERDRENNYFAYISDKAYYIGDVNYFRPVYAHDSKAYTTLFTQYAQQDLSNFYKEEVKALVDINGDLQLFGANVEYNEGMVMVEQVLAKGQVKFVQPDNERLILDEDYSSVISHVNSIGGTTTNQRLNTFDARDLAFVLGNDGKIASLVRIKTEDDMKEPDALEQLMSTKAVDMNNSFIRISATKRYQVLDRTNVFVVNANGSITGTTVAKLQASLKANTNIDAFVLTDNDVTALVAAGTISDRNRISNDANVAHTIVFFNPEYSGALTDGETVLLDRVYTAQTIHSLEGIRADNMGKATVTRVAARASVSFAGVTMNDIVSLRLTKNDDKFVESITMLIPATQVNSESYKVVGGDVNYSRYEGRNIIIEDANKNQTPIWLVRGVEEFGTVTLDSVVTFHTDGNGDIDVIRVYGKNTPVTANAGRPNQTGIVAKVVPKVAGLEAIVVDGNAPYFLNAKTILVDKNGVVITMTADAVYNALNDGDKVEVTVVGDVMTIKRLATVDELTTETNLLDAKDAAAALNQADYTAASWTLLTDALALPETTKALKDAKVIAINNALNITMVFAGQANLDLAQNAAGLLDPTAYTAVTWAQYQADYVVANALPETTNAEVVAKTNAINAAIAKLVEKAEAVAPTGLTVATTDDTELVITATGLLNTAIVTQTGLGVTTAIIPTADTITVTLPAAASGTEAGVVTVVVAATATHKAGTFMFDLTRTGPNAWTFVAQ